MKKIRLIHRNLTVKGDGEEEKWHFSFVSNQVNICSNNCNIVNEFGYCLTANFTAATCNVNIYHRTQCDQMLE